MMQRPITVVFVLIGAAAILTVGFGCGRATRAGQIPIDGIKLAQEYGTVVEVDNWSGSVYVRAVPGLQKPEVSVRYRAVSEDSPKVGELPTAADVRATASIEGPERLLRVVSRPADDPPRPVAVDLYIHVAKLAAARIRNAGGAVELVGVDGPVHVDNGYAGSAGGDVQVRTGAAMTYPVRMSTTEGKVLYQVGPGSSGRFDLVSDDGETKFYSKLGQVDEVFPEKQHYRSVLDQGQNPVALRTGKGLVQVRVIENAATYGPDLWDGTPRWPKYPRIVGRLGGYHNEEPARMPWQKRPAGSSSTAAPHTGD